MHPACWNRRRLRRPALPYLRRAAPRRWSNRAHEHCFAQLCVNVLQVAFIFGSGDRMVGVVTHVPELAERMPVQYRVRSDADGFMDYLYNYQDPQSMLLRADQVIE